MVKNKFGGNRHKKMASKDVKIISTRKTRFVKEEGEIYARVSKLSGGGHALIECSDGVERTLVIRNKFKKRNKRDNSINEGAYILAGLRLWEVVGPKKKQKADLLYVYGKSEVTDIIATNKNLGKLFQSMPEEEVESVVEFDIRADMSFNNTKTVQINKKVNVKKDEKLSAIEEKDEVNFDWDEI